MANRTGSERAGRGHARPPQGLVEERGGRESDEGDGPTEMGNRGGSAWERMLQALGGEDDRMGPDDGFEALRASIAERMHTRGESPSHEEGPGRVQPRPARRRRR
jgi:hypothetical protein